MPAVGAQAVGTDRGLALAVELLFNRQVQIVGREYPDGSLGMVTLARPGSALGAFRLGNGGYLWCPTAGAALATPCSGGAATRRRCAWTLRAPRFRGEHTSRELLRPVGQVVADVFCGPRDRPCSVSASGAQVRYVRHLHHRIPFTVGNGGWPPLRLPIDPRARNRFAACVAHANQYADRDASRGESIRARGGHSRCDGHVRYAVSCGVCGVRFDLSAWLFN